MSKNKKPKLSIICPSYNNEPYINYFISSVLNQTEKDFELIIIDDCSTDNGLELIENYNDKRIRVIKNKFNQGINHIFNKVIPIAKSDYISIIASDDILAENYVEKITLTFENPVVDVIYVELQIINEENVIIEGYKIQLPNKAEYELLRDLFYKGNQVPSPGMSFKKKAFIDILPLPSGLINYSDWQWHNRLLLDKNKIFYINEPLVFYRRHEASISYETNKNLIRCELETDLMMEVFLSIKSTSKLKEIFGEKIECKNDADIPFFLGKLALESENIDIQKWGYKKIIDFVSKANNLEKLYHEYKIDYSTIINYVDKIEITKKSLISNSILKKKRKKYIIQSCTFTVILNLIIIFFYFKLINFS